MCSVLDRASNIIMCIELDTNSTFFASIPGVVFPNGIFSIDYLIAIGWY